MKTITLFNTTGIISKLSAQLMLLAGAVCFGSTTLLAQTDSNNHYVVGTGISTFISGNSHGTGYEGTINLSNGSNVFSLGACMLKRKSTLSGVSVGYQKNMITLNDDSDQDNQNGALTLNFFTRAQYTHKASLSYRAEKRNQDFYVPSDDKIDFTKYKTSTVDLFAGFGLDVNLSRNLVWSNKIGFGTYYHIDYVKGMYNDRMAPVLFLGTGIRINSFK